MRCVTALLARGITVLDTGYWTHSEFRAENPWDATCKASTLWVAWKEVSIGMSRCTAGLFDHRYLRPQMSSSSQPTVHYRCVFYRFLNSRRWDSALGLSDIAEPARPRVGNEKYALTRRAPADAPARGSGALRPSPRKPATLGDGVETFSHPTPPCSFSSSRLL